MKQDFNLKQITISIKGNYTEWDEMVRKFDDKYEQARIKLGTRIRFTQPFQITFGEVIILGQIIKYSMEQQ